MRPHCGLMRGYMSELLRELEDDLRQERFDQLWQKFGKIMLGVSGAIILATAIGVVWNNHEKKIAGEETTLFLRGIAEANGDHEKDAIDTFGQLAADRHSPYYGLAMLRKAQAETDSGDKAAAAKTYQEAAASNDVLAPLAAMLAPDSGTPLAPQKNAAFYFAEREWGGWQMLAAGKKEAAVSVFLSVRDDPAAPRTMRQRMQEVLQHIAPAKAMSDEKMRDERKK